MMLSVLGLLAALIGENLLPGFEPDNAGGWLGWNQGPVEVVGLPEPGPGGAPAIRFSAGEGDAEFVHRWRRLAPGGGYRMSAWVRTRALRMKRAELLNYDHQWLGENRLPLPEDTAGEWRRIEWTGEFKACPSGDYAVGVYFSDPIPAGGYVDLADLRLEALEASLAAAASPLPELRAFAARISPVAPELRQLDAANAKLRAYYPGSLPAGSGRLSGSVAGKTASASLKADPSGYGWSAELEFGPIPSGEHELVLSVATDSGVVREDRYQASTRVEVKEPTPGRRLNNFVTEILNEPLADGDYVFTLAEARMVYIGFDQAVPGVTAAIDGCERAVRFRDGEPSETMRRLAAGRHVVKVSGVDRWEVKNRRLIIRLVKDIFCDALPYAVPQSLDFLGYRYGEGFFRRFHLLSGFNVGGFRWKHRETPEGAKVLAEMAERGVEIVWGCGLLPDHPWRDDYATLVQKVADYPPCQAGEPASIDENRISLPAEKKVNFTEMMWTLGQRGQRLDVMYADGWHTGFTRPGLDIPELSAAVNSGGGSARIIAEAYYNSPANPADCRATLEFMRRQLQGMRALVPSAPRHYLYMFSGWYMPTIWTTWNHVQVDMNVYLAKLVHALAVDPEFADVGGVGFSAPCCEDDVLRFAYRVFRHYCIDGRTDDFARSLGLRLFLGHLQNGDFEHGLDGWTVSAAEPGGIIAGKLRGFGRRQEIRQQREGALGDDFALFTRSAKGPNRLRQTLRALQPGRVYQLSYLTLDYEDMLKPHSVEVEKCAAFRARVIGADELPGLAHQQLIRGKPDRHVDRAAVDYRRLVFRARGTTAELEFDDWATDAEPGGRIGQQRALHYICVRPYPYRDESELRELQDYYDQQSAKWIAAADQPVSAAERLVPGQDYHSRIEQCAAPGVSWMVGRQRNLRPVRRAVWKTAGLGVYELYVNGRRVGDDFLKPGFTDWRKTKYAYSYEVTALMKTESAAENYFAAEVSSGWWRDKIVNFAGKKCAFRGELLLEYADGTTDSFVTDRSWRAGVAGPVRAAAIFDGEDYDARQPPPFTGEGLAPAELNWEFKGEIAGADPARVGLREDLAIRRGPYSLKRGDKLVIDFGQNCAAVPRFRFRARAGTELTALPAEMLNDADAPARNCDGPKGSIYRENLRVPWLGMQLKYTFSGHGTEEYLPRHTYFGYRYLELSATDEVEIESVESVPVSSVSKEMENGTFECGNRDINQLVSNVRWGMRSNYLSVPTDCPQRNERLGWTADTQVFAETGTYLADIDGFLRKWLRDLRDAQYANGAFPSVAPVAQYGEEPDRFGWGDAGVIVPYGLWKQYGDLEVLKENRSAIERYLQRLEHTKGATLPGRGQFADWLSFERYQPANAPWRNGPPAEALEYWDFLGGCYWLDDERKCVELFAALGDDAAAKRHRDQERRALDYLRSRFVAADGLLSPTFRDLQTASLFALKLGVVATPAAMAATRKLLKDNLKAHGWCLQTGFLGTSILMDTLTEQGMSDVAYAVLLNHGHPGWLYSVDQGATTVWERWNSWTKKDGFGIKTMNSFNHYAYGCVLSWLFKTAAGIAADSRAPGFRRIVMRPVPDRRLGFVKASYRSAVGRIVSEWRYEGSKWIWNFTVPAGAVAEVTAPGESASRLYSPGTYVIEKEGLE